MRQGGAQRAAPDALESTGVDAVDLDRAVALPDALGFVATIREAAPGKPDLHVVPDPDRDEKALAAAREALEEAEGELTEATEAFDEAAKELSDLEARSMQIQAEIDELKRKIAELEETGDEVDDEIAEAEEARDEARRSSPRPPRPATPRRRRSQVEA